MLQARVTLTAFPIATPRGRSVSFPTRGTMVTYVTYVHTTFNVVTLIIFVFVTQLESNVAAFGVQMFFSNLFNTKKVSVGQNTGMLSACA